MKERRDWALVGRVRVDYEDGPVTKGVVVGA